MTDASHLFFRLAELNPRNLHGREGMKKSGKSSDGKAKGSSSASVGGKANEEIDDVVRKWEELKGGLYTEG